MKKCALVVGHKKTSKGATNKRHNISEFEFNDLLAGKIEMLVRGVEVQKIYRRTYETLPCDINEYDPDFIISLHCNAFDKKASGTEVLYYHRSAKGKLMSELLNKRLVWALGLNDRGIKPKTVEDLGGPVLKYTNDPCVIAEPFFIDNDHDYMTAVNNIDGLAKAYANSIQEIAELWN